MVKYIKIKGNDCYFQQCWGIGWVDTKQPKEIIAMVRESDIQYVEKKINNKDVYLMLLVLTVSNGVFSLASQRIMVRSIEECTPSEIEQINAALDYHGMYWGTKEITKKSLGSYMGKVLYMKHIRKRARVSIGKVKMIWFW